jgi:hypothetical protein
MLQRQSVRQTSHFTEKMETGRRLSKNAAIRRSYQKDVPFVLCPPQLSHCQVYWACPLTIPPSPTQNLQEIIPFNHTLDKEYSSLLQKANCTTTLNCGWCWSNVSRNVHNIGRQSSTNGCIKRRSWYLINSAHAIMFSSKESEDEGHLWI